MVMSRSSARNLTTPKLLLQIVRVGSTTHAAAAVVVAAAAVITVTI